jgi:hypothetical protein
MGRDTFLIARQAATGFSGLGNLKAQAIADGVAHCGAQGKEFQIVRTDESRPPYILGNFPRTEITFMCLGAGDPELQRPKLHKEPDTVVEVRKP